jgi:soluble lytic murein transglycosylase-like protein
MIQTIMLISLLATAGGNYGPPLPSETVKLQEFILKRAYVLQTPLYPFEAVEIALATINSAEEFKIEPLKILALIEIESRYDAKAKSKKKCLGLTQMAKNTALNIAKALNIMKYDLFIISDAVRLGVAFLAENIRHNRAIEVSYDIYNRGIGNWMKHPKVSNYGFATKKRYRYLKSLYKKESDKTCEK